MSIEKVKPQKKSTTNRNIGRTNRDQIFSDRVGFSQESMNLQNQIGNRGIQTWLSKQVTINENKLARNSHIESGENEEDIQKAQQDVVTTETIARVSAINSTLSRAGGLLGISPLNILVDDTETGTEIARQHDSIGVVANGVIHLDAEQFDPTTPLGRHVLSHEMAHIAQQRLSGSAPLHTAEKEASLFADAFTTGQPVPTIQTPLSTPARPTWYPPGEGAVEHPEQTQISPKGFIVEIPYVHVERLWYERHFGATGSNAAAMSAILDDMAQHPAYSHIRDLTPERRAEANASIHTWVNSWDEDNTTRISINSDVYGLIGLPPGITCQWEFPKMLDRSSDRPPQYYGRCIVKLEALEPEGAPRQASETLMRQILDSLESNTALTIDGSARNVLISQGTLNQSLSREGLAVFVPCSRDYMVALFGEHQWSSFEARRSSGEVGETGEPVEGGVTFDESLSPADREFAERFWEDIFGTNAEGEPVSLYVGPTLISIWREINTHKRRSEIIAILRGATTPDQEETAENSEHERRMSDIDRFRLAIHSVELNLEYQRLGINTENVRKTRRPYDFPVEGYIQNYSDLLFAGREGAFSFVTTSRHDAFAIPWVDVNWVVRRASAPEDAGIVIERDHTSHLDYPTEAPERLEYEFEEPGIYEINALVDHRFYVPETFTIYVEVKTERERMGKLTEHTFGGGVFDTLPPDGSLAEGVEEGELLPGQCLPGELIPGDIEAIEQQAERIRQYLASGNVNPRAIESAREYLQEMEETIREIRAEQEAGATTLLIQGVYLSRSTHGTSQELTLVATAVRQNSDWQIAIHDTTQAFDIRNSRYTGEGSSFTTALDEVIDDLGESYPTGTMNVRIETLNDSAQPTGRFVSYTIDCNSVWEEIETTVWAPTAQLVINIGGTVVAIFAPVTAPVIIPALIAYNATEVISRLHAYGERGALETTDIAIGMGQLAIDLIPYVGRASKIISVGGRAYYVLEGVELAGDVALMTADSMEQLGTLRFGAVRQAAELHTQIQQLEAQNPSDPRLPALREAFERAQDTVREEFELFATTFAQQGIMRGSMRTIDGIAQYRAEQVSTSRMHLEDAVRSRGDEAMQGGDIEHIHRVTGIPVQATGSGSDVRISFDVGPHGGITNMRLEVGPEASLSMVRAHEITVAAMRRYEGITGSLRNLLERVQAYIRGGGHIPPGSRAFEAHFELQKLPRIVQEFRDRLAAGGLDQGIVGEIQRQISSLETQIHQHAQHLDDLAPGLGFVAARGEDAESDFGMMGHRPDERASSESSIIPAPPSREVQVRPELASTLRHQELLRMRGTTDLVLTNRSEGWTGHHEAEFRYGSAALDNIPEGYHWVIDRYGTPTVVRTRMYDNNGNLRSRIRYVGDGRFEDIPDTVNRAQTTRIEDDFVVPERVEAEFEQIISARERARDARNEAEAELQTLADRMELSPEDLRNIDDTIERLRREHAGDPEMMRRVEELAAKREELAGHRRSVVEQSELLGQRMAEEWVISRHPNATLIYGGTGAGSRPGDFDQVWLVPGAGPNGRNRIIIVEAKGGSSQLGTRIVEGQPEQQGTVRYMREIARLMRLQENLSEATADVMRDIGRHGRYDDGPQIQYVLVQAPVGQVGGQATARPGQVSEFDISGD